MQAVGKRYDTARAIHGALELNLNGDDIVAEVAHELAHAVILRLPIRRNVGEEIAMACDLMPMAAAHEMRTVATHVAAARALGWRGSLRSQVAVAIIGVDIGGSAVDIWPFDRAYRYVAAYKPSPVSVARIVRVFRDFERYV